MVPFFSNIFYQLFEKTPFLFHINQLILLKLLHIKIYCNEYKVQHQINPLKLYNLLTPSNVYSNRNDHMPCMSRIMVLKNHSVNDLIEFT